MDTLEKPHYCLGTCSVHKGLSVQIYELFGFDPWIISQVELTTKSVCFITAIFAIMNSIAHPIR